MKEYYERRAPEYDATSWEHPDASDEQRREQRALLDALRRLRPATTLDVACGTGFLTRHLPGAVVALDHSETMLGLARTKARNCSFLRADALRLPFKDGSFDRVFSANFYGHLQQSEAAQFLSEARRVSKELVIVDAAPGHRISETDWEERSLADGSTYAIFKRFFEPYELIDELGGGTVLFAGSDLVAVAG
ncbi:MAG: class I SAM-dependent methyltransferase [Actinomycetota bacterium]|nr:class I SAM-dependent methyltransferase [Actinomycetota bacterium]